jgi:antitoxin MazE
MGRKVSDKFTVPICRPFSSMSSTPAASGRRDKSSTKRRFGRGGEDWVRFAENGGRRSSPPPLYRLPKPNAGSAAVLVDERKARGIANLVSARWDCVAPIYSVDPVYLLKEIAMLVEFCKWGNSLAVRIPKTVAEALKVGVGRHAEIAIENGALVLRPIRRPKRKPTYTLEELLRGMTKQNVPQELDWGEPRGNEAW